MEYNKIRKKVSILWMYIMVISAWGLIETWDWLRGRYKEELDY